MTEQQAIQSLIDAANRIEGASTKELKRCVKVIHACRRVIEAMTNRVVELEERVDHLERGF